MPYYDVANLVIVTKMNIIDGMPCGCGTLRTTGVKIWHQISGSTWDEVSASPDVCYRAVLSSQLVSMYPAEMSRKLSSSKI